MRTWPETAAPRARATVPPTTMRSPVITAVVSSTASPLITSSVPSTRPPTITGPLRTATSPRQALPAGGGPRPSPPVPGGGRRRAREERALIAAQPPRRRPVAPRLGGRPGGGAVLRHDPRHIVGGHRIAGREDREPLHDVRQLAHVPGPAVAREQLDRAGVEADRPAEACYLARREMLDQRSDVVGPVAQRRDADPGHL